MVTTDVERFDRLSQRFDRTTIQVRGCQAFGPKFDFDYQTLPTAIWRHWAFHCRPFHLKWFANNCFDSISRAQPIALQRTEPLGNAAALRIIAVLEYFASPNNDEGYDPNAS
mgnify:CR=1 FL=1